MSKLGFARLGGILLASVLARGSPFLSETSQPNCAPPGLSSRRSLYLRSILSLEREDVLRETKQRGSEARPL